MVGERRDEQRELVGRGRHVGVGEDDEVGRRGEHPGADRRALAAVRDAQHAQVSAVASPDRSHASGRAATMRDGLVRAAVVDDEDLDRPAAGSPVRRRAQLAARCR